MVCQRISIGMEEKLQLIFWIFKDIVRKSNIYLKIANLFCYLPLCRGIVAICLFNHGGSRGAGTMLSAQRSASPRQPLHGWSCHSRATMPHRR